MAFRPLLPGILSSGAAQAGGAQITMGDYFTDAYYVSAQAENDLGFSETGSATGDLSADGGTLEVLANQGLYILGGNQSATNLNVDGTDYALTFNQSGGGYDLYDFSASPFVIGNTYTVVVT